MCAANFTELVCAAAQYGQQQAAAAKPTYGSQAPAAQRYGAQAPGAQGTGGYGAPHQQQQAQQQQAQGYGSNSAQPAHSGYQQVKRRSLESARVPALYLPQELGTSETGDQPCVAPW